jgi:hypothetical protein
VNIIILSAVLGGTMIAAFFAVLNVLFGGIVEKAAMAAEDTPGRAFMVGVVNIIFLGIISMGFIALSRAVGADFLQIPSLVVGVFLVVCLVFGLAGMAKLVGARLASESGENFRIALGGLALTFACATPYVGWFGLLPYLMLRGVGGLILGVFSRPVSTE